MSDHECTRMDTNGLRFSAEEKALAMREVVKHFRRRYGNEGCGDGLPRWEWQRRHVELLEEILGEYQERVVVEDEAGFFDGERAAGGGCSTLVRRPADAGVPGRRAGDE